MEITFNLNMLDYFFNFLRDILNLTNQEDVIRLLADKSLLEVKLREAQVKLADQDGILAATLALLDSTRISVANLCNSLRGEAAASTRSLVNSNNVDSIENPQPGPSMLLLIANETTTAQTTHSSALKLNIKKPVVILDRIDCPPPTENASGGIIALPQVRRKPKPKLVCGTGTVRQSRGPRPGGLARGSRRVLSPPSPRWRV